MKDLYKKYKDYLPALFFVIGFSFDLLTTDRIDQTFSLTQQLVYLIMLMFLFFYEVVPVSIFKREKGFLAKIWLYHVELLHFLFGSLLSLYTIFYFKSASLMSSFFFMIFLASLLIINELPRFQKQGVSIRAALLALCLSSYFIYLVPVITGQIGVSSFLLAMVLSASLFLWLCVRLLKKNIDKNWLQKKILAPALIVQIVFVGLYFFKVLPPVPISLKYIGIYHNIEKKEGQFSLTFERHWLRFWQSGAQTFVKREGDKVYCFVSVFSPTQFKENLKLEWYQKAKNGWIKVDTVGLPIRGGRDQGFRGFAYKAHFDWGLWQVRVKTSDDREVGRIGFNVVMPQENSTRVWREDLF